MSLDQKKESLFGKSGNSSKPSAPLNAPVSAPQPVSKTAGITFGKTTTTGGSSNKGKIELSAEGKRKKLVEAQELSAKGAKNLQTSLFQWSPDHLMAAPYFEQASECYKQAGDYENALSMALKAAESYDACNTLASAALARNKAYLVAKEMDNKKRAIKCLMQCAETWGIHGDLQKYGEVLGKVAKEMEDFDNKKAEDTYFKAINILCPDDTPLEAIKKCHPSLIELLRSALTFLLRCQAYQSALILSRKMIKVFQAFELEAALCKAMAGVTVIQLTLGDVVAAQQTYLQEHLNNALYIRSKECELMDNLLMACNNMDADLLDKVKMDPQLQYFDGEVQKLVRQVALFDLNSEDPVESQPIKVLPVQDKATLFATKQEATSSSSSNKVAQHLDHQLDGLQLEDHEHEHVDVTNEELDEVMAGLEDSEDEWTSDNNADHANNDGNNDDNIADNNNNNNDDDDNDKDKDDFGSHVHAEEDEDDDSKWL